MTLYEKNLAYLEKIAFVPKKRPEASGEMVPAGERARRLKAALEYKIAEAKEPPAEHPALTLGKGVLGLGVGTVAGYLGTKGVDWALQRAGHPGVSSTMQWTMPLASGAMGLAAPYFHEKMVQQMRDNHLKRVQAAQESKKSGTAT